MRFIAKTGCSSKLGMFTHCIVSWALLQKVGMVKIWVITKENSCQCVFQANNDKLSIARLIWTSISNTHIIIQYNPK